MKTEYNNWLKSRSDADFNKLYPHLIEAASKVAYKSFAKTGIKYYHTRNPQDWDFLVSDMVTEFYLEHRKKGGKWVCKNIHTWMRFAFMRIQYGKDKIKNDKVMPFEDIFAEYSYWPKERDWKETEYIDYILDHPAGKTILYFLSKKMWSYARIFEVLIESYNINKRWIKDNATILIRVAKILRGE